MFTTASDNAPFCGVPLPLPLFSKDICVGLSTILMILLFLLLLLLLLVISQISQVD